MATVWYPSHSDAEVIEVEFVSPGGSVRPARLLVDSGFTGESELVLSVDAEDLAWTPISSAQVTGALQGQQDRALVMCRASGLKPEWLLVAILADLSHLSLPKDVDGIVGLRFLRRFARWGAEWTADAGWQFFLTEKETAA